MNETMRQALEDAAQLRSIEVIGKKMNPYHLGVVMEASLSHGVGGFDKRTLWIALELATEENP